MKLNSCTCFLMYFSKAVLDHLLICMIEKTGTPARYMAIAAPKRMDLVLISDWRMLSFVSSIVTTPSRHKLAIISPVMLMILLLCFRYDASQCQCGTTCDPINLILRLFSGTCLHTTSYKTMTLNNTNNQQTPPQWWWSRPTL